MSELTHPYSLAPYRPVALADLVRVGRHHDGGYVISQRSVAATRVLVGLGINADWSFEEAFVQANPAVRVVGLDGSVSGGVFRRRSAGGVVRGALAAARGRLGEAARHSRAASGYLRVGRDFTRFFDGAPHVFVQKYLADVDSPTQVTWDTFAREQGLRAGPPAGLDVFVKMDIEGAEYRALGALLADAGRINGLVVEFHDCDLLWERFAEIMAALDRDFAVAHMHGNNCVPLISGTSTPRVLEISFVNRCLLVGEAMPAATEYPLGGLDMPNDPARPDYPLVF